MNRIKIWTFAAATLLAAAAGCEKRPASTGAPDASTTGIGAVTVPGATGTGTGTGAAAGTQHDGGSVGAVLADAGTAAATGTATGTTAGTTGDAGAGGGAMTGGDAGAR